MIRIATYQTLAHKITCSGGGLATTLAAGLLLLVSGCSDSDSPVDTILDSESPVDAIVDGDSPVDTIVDGDSTEGDAVTISISASGSQEIPANASSGSASGTLNLNQTTGVLSGMMTTDGVAATIAHIHDGIAGTNGGPVVTLEVDGSTISVPDLTVLAADQIQSLLNGSYYVNIHSGDFPGGEVRAQITTEGIEVIQTELSGANEVPAVETAGTGTGYVTLNTTTGAMQVVVLTDGLITPSASHVHSGPVGENGGVLFPLVQDSAEVGNFSGEVSELEPDDLATVLAGGTYINVHSAEFGSGELRGQIER